MKKWLSDFGIGLLLGIALAFMLAWLTYTIIILKKDPALANAYVAVGTLILAIVTALLVGFTWLNIRNTHEKEERDRKERLLNEIIEWAEDVARLNFNIYNLTEAQVSKESWVESSLGGIVSEFQVVEAKGVYINSIALSCFKEDKSFSKAIKDVNK